MTDANDRRNEWLARQAAADYASALTPSPLAGDAAVDALKKQAREISAARAAVVKAAMLAWNCGLYTLPTNVADACAALAQLEG